MDGSQAAVRASPAGMWARGQFLLETPAEGASALPLVPSIVGGQVALNTLVWTRPPWPLGELQVGSALLISGACECMSVGVRISIGTTKTHHFNLFICFLRRAGPSPPSGWIA